MINTTRKQIFNPYKSRRFYFGPTANQRMAVLHIKKKQKNLYLTVTDLLGCVIRSISAKIVMQDRKKRFAPHVVELATRVLGVYLRTYRISSVRILSKFPRTYLLRSVGRALRGFGVTATLIMDLTPIPHNGCRKKKLRRL